MRSAVLVGILVWTGIASAGSTKLVVVSRPARASIRVKYASSDPPAGFPMGPGAGPANVSASFIIEGGQSRAKWSLPAGASSGGGPGWTVNDASRALYRNRTAPAGPTGIDRTLVVYGTKIKVDAKSGHDAWDPLPLPGNDDVAIGMTVTNGADTTNHCTTFPAGSCMLTSLDAGTGFKLVCPHGVADPSCAAIPVCGDGIRAQGEQCDGGAACGPTCSQGIPDCCQGAGVCMDAPLFSLYNNLQDYCSAQMPGSTPSPGGICMPDGSCAVEPIAPLTMCCQQTPSTCFGEVDAGTADLWHFQNVCRGAYLGTVVPLATCGPDGVCQPGY